MLSCVNAPSYRPGRIATLAEFAERWRTEVLIHRKPSGVRAAESHLRCHILPLLGRVKVEDLGLEVQQTFVTRLTETVSSKTTANVMGTLSVILSAAKNWGYICEPVNFGKLVMPSEEVKEAARFFTTDEAKQIIAAAGQPFRTMFAIAAMTGMRVGEILALQIDDLDFDRRMIHVRRSVWLRRIHTRFLFPFLQNAKCQIGKRKRLGGSRRLHVVSEVDETVLPIHLVPTKPEAFAVRSSPRLYEQNDTHAKMGRRRVQDAILLIQGEHLFGRPSRSSLKCFTARAGFSGMYFR
jgi:integrase